MKLTAAQLGALKWLRNRGGDGAFDKTRCLIAQGERAGVSRSTWTRLHDVGAVEIYVPEGAKHKRCRVTEAGKKIDISRASEACCRDIGQEAYA